MLPPQSIKLLIIEDHEDLLNTMAVFFRRKNCRVMTAVNGLEGLKRIEAAGGAIDLIITDIVMPHIGGVGIISIVKKRYPHIPLIAITGRGEHPEALATEAAAELVLSKPVKLRALYQAMQHLLADNTTQGGFPLKPVIMDS